MSVIEFRTLGTLGLRAADGRELHSLLAQSKRIALLVYLCIAQPRGFHRRDKLLGLFWPDSDHDHARASLRKSLHILRQSLGEDTILSRGDEDVSVNFERISCDAVKFEESLRAERFEEALELYRGDLLPGFFVDEAPEFEQWLTLERASLRSSSARGALAVANEFETRANLAAAVTWARRSLELSDTDESALRKLIGLQHRAGDRGGAIQSYEAFARHLASEYQTEPSLETRSLIERIRSGEESSANGSKARVFAGEKPDEAANAAPPGAESISRGAKRGRREKILFVLAAASVLVAAGFMSNLLRPAPAKSVALFTLVLNSTEPLAMRMPEAGRLAISPDGSRLVYMSGSRNAPDVSLLRIRRWNDLHAVAISGSQDSKTPFFSPDGLNVGFLRQRSVWIASATGGPPVQVSDSLSGTAGASWGIDGFIYADGFEFTPLMRVEAKPRSPAKRFTALDSGEIEHNWPCVLPNAKAVLFTVTISGKDRADGQASFAIAVADIPSGKHRIIIQDGSYPVYILTGHVLYVNAKRTLMMVPFDQNSMTVTGEPIALIDGMRRDGWGAGTDLAVSSNGTLVYSPDTVLSKYLTELVWITPEGLSIPVDPEWHGFFRDPSISPDGKLLAISKREPVKGDRDQSALSLKHPEGQSADVWIKQLDRGPATRLTQERMVNESPTWTPDGKSVTFNAHSGDGRWYLWTQRADRTAKAATIPHADSMFDARWSPDGKWLVFTAGKFDGPTQYDVFGFRPGIDTTPVALVKGKHIDVTPEISPDGRWLAYASNETGLSQIYVVPFPNTREGKWAVTSASGVRVRWGRRGNELFYRDTSGNFYSVPVRSSPRFWSGTPKLLYQASRFEFPWGYGYAVAPDDRLLAIRVLDPYATDKIVVVENWFEELKSKLH